MIIPYASFSQRRPRGCDLQLSQLLSDVVGHTTQAPLPLCPISQFNVFEAQYRWKYGPTEGYFLPLTD